MKHYYEVKVLQSDLLAVKLPAIYLKLSLKKAMEFIQDLSEEDNTFKCILKRIKYEV